MEILNDQDSIFIGSHKSIYYSENDSWIIQFKANVYIIEIVYNMVAHELKVTQVEVYIETFTIDGY